AIPHLVDQCTRFRLGDACDPNTTMGPVINQTQYENIRRYIQSGIDEGAKLVCGGLGRPEGLDQGFFIQPTVFSDVTATMTIAKDRKSTRLNSSHVKISYAVFCLKKKIEY